MWNRDTLEHIPHLCSPPPPVGGAGPGARQVSGTAQQRGGVAGLSFLPTASSFRLSLKASFLICQGKEYPPHLQEGKAGYRAGLGKHTADVVEATIFCFCCTSWLRSHGLSSGLHLKMLLKFKELAVVCHPQEGEVCYCMAFSDLCVEAIFKLFTMGARQRYLFKKADGVWIPGAL